MTDQRRELGSDESTRFLLTEYQHLADCFWRNEEAGEKRVNSSTATGTHEGELMGMPATGKQATTVGININRVAGGKLVEGWGLFDQLGLLQQIGAVPVPTRV